MRIVVGLLAALLIAATAVVWSGESAFACDGTGVLVGNCTTTGQVTDTSVTVTATEIGPTTTGSTTDEHLPPTTPAKKTKLPPTPPKKLNGRIIVTTANSPITNVVCTNARNCNTAPPVDTTDTQEGRGPVTLADIAAFHPTTGTTSMEPNGWAVIRLQTNPYSSAARHVIAGRLLGRAADVRFTPTGWHWDYGDGDVRDSTTPGGSWKSLGVAEFGRTTTSHSYDTAGTYTVEPSIRFTAEYRFDGGDWTPIAGGLTVDAASVTVVVGTASTVLVGADCASDPAAPGC